MTNITKPWILKSESTGARTTGNENNEKKKLQSSTIRIFMITVDLKHNAFLIMLIGLKPGFSFLFSHGNLLVV